MSKGFPVAASSVSIKAAGLAIAAGAGAFAMVETDFAPLLEDEPQPLSKLKSALEDPNAAVVVSAAPRKRRRLEGSVIVENSSGNPPL